MPSNPFLSNSNKRCMNSKNQMLKKTSSQEASSQKQEQDLRLNNFGGFNFLINFAYFTL